MTTPNKDQSVREKVRDLITNYYPAFQGKIGEENKKALLEAVHALYTAHILKEMGVEEIRKINGITIYCAESKENHNAVLSFNIDGWDAADVGTMLDVDHNIACRTGLQCAPLVHEQLGTTEIHGTVRLSVGPFNTAQHIDKAIEAVQEIAAIKK